MNLAVADIIYSLFMIPELIFDHITTHPEVVTGKVLCILLTGGNLAWVGGICSVFTLVFIAAERHYAVIYPLGNKGKLTIRKLKVFLCNNSQANSFPVSNLGWGIFTHPDNHTRQTPGLFS